MASFNTILCKLLYPKNTLEEVKDIYITKPTPVVELFTDNMKYKNIASIFKTPKYKDFLFFLSNPFLFYNDMEIVRTPERGTSVGVCGLSGETTKEFNRMNEPGIKSIYTIVSHKYKFLKKNINTFMSFTIDNFIDLFRDVQKHYFAFARFANIWKYKRAPVQIEHDLYMTPLDRNNRNVFSLLQQCKIYLFTSANLVNCICTSLSNCPDFFVEPLVIKNPYNNIPLNKSDLYNIYFFLKHSPIIMPILFHNYFLADFDLHKFSIENENIIKHMAFKSYIRNAPVSTLYCSSIHMLKRYNKKIVIHKDFPKEVLVNIMRPYLLLYYIIEYSSEEYRIINAEEMLKYKLKKLYKYNVAFGRKIVKLKRIGFSTRRQRYIEFSDNHPNFEDPVDMEAFQKTHTEIIDNESSSSEDETPNNQTIDYTNNDSDNDLPYTMISPHQSIAISHNIFTIIHNTSVIHNTSNMNIVRESYSEFESDSDETTSNEVVIEGDSDSDDEEEEDDN
jgi:hypothetical protein